jgi:hypothetical protein
MHVADPVELVSRLNMYINAVVVGVHKDIVNILFDCDINHVAVHWCHHQM